MNPDEIHNLCGCTGLGKKIIMASASGTSGGNSGGTGGDGGSHIEVVFFRGIDCAKNRA